MRNLFVSLSLLISFVFFTVGCGSGGPKLYPVKGKITIDGKPAQGVQISFYPSDPKEPIASSQVASDGTYELRSTTENRPGAVAGKYKVVLTQVAASGDAAASAYAKGGKAGKGGAMPGMPAATFPSEYGSATTSPKEVEVKPESNTIDIEI